MEASSNDREISVESSRRSNLDIDLRTTAESSVCVQIWLHRLQKESNSKGTYFGTKDQRTQILRILIWNRILKLRPHLNEVLIDQIPNLIHLQRFLEELVVSQPPAYKSELIIEQVPEIYDGLLRKYKGKWKEIAVNQSKTVLDPSEAEIREKAKRYNKNIKIRQKD